MVPLSTFHYVTVSVREITKSFDGSATTSILRSRGRGAALRTRGQAPAYIAATALARHPPTGRRHRRDTAHARQTHRPDSGRENISDAGTQTAGTGERGSRERAPGATRHHGFGVDRLFELDPTDRIDCAHLGRVSREASGRAPAAEGIT